MANHEHLDRLSRGATSWNDWRRKQPLGFQPDLSRANLNRADLSGTHLFEADLSGAKLNGAVLSKTILSRTNLSGADLSKTDLSGAQLNGAILREADLTQAAVGWTHFADVDLHQVKGLETVRHGGPSHISIDTIYRSQGDISETFLRQAGVPDNFIDFIHSPAFKHAGYYSCFISYSSKDQAFAERLHTDLQSKGVRCWLPQKI